MYVLTEVHVFNSSTYIFLDSAITQLARAHTTLSSKNDPFYGNDVMKIFIWKLVELAFYDQTDYNM